MNEEIIPYTQDMSTLQSIGWITMMIIVMPFIYLFAIIVTSGNWIYDKFKKWKGRCKYIKTCEWYNVDSPVCNETAGYFHPNKLAGCWKTNREKRK